MNRNWKLKVSSESVFSEVNCHFCNYYFQLICAKMLIGFMLQHSRIFCCNLFTEFLTKKENSLFHYGYSTSITYQALKITYSLLRINTENKKNLYMWLAVFLNLGLKDNILQTDKYLSAFEGFTVMWCSM